MLRIGKLTDYATVIVTWLASRDDWTSGSEVAAAVHLETPTASKVLKQLAQAGLVESCRGPHGGYRLAMAPEQISVAAVIEAIEGPIGMTECSVQSGLCANETVCGLRGNWQRISRAIAAVLNDLSVADLTTPSVGSMQIPIHLADS